MNEDVRIAKGMNHAHIWRKAFDPESSMQKERVIKTARWSLGLKVRGKWGVRGEWQIVGHCGV